MLEYRLARATDADQLIDLVCDCYGDSYPYDLFYDAEQLREKLATELLVCAVAVASDGRLVGQVATLWEEKSALTADGMAGMIRVAYQRQGVLGKLTSVLAPYLFESGVTGLQLYGVTTHDITQHRALDNGGVEVGFLLPDFPATMEAGGIRRVSLGERNPSLVIYYSFKPVPPRKCYVSTAYKSMMAQIYQQTRSTRELVESADSQTIGPTVSTEHTDERKLVSRLCLRHIGEDWRARTAGFRRRALTDARFGWYLDIPLVQPAAIDVVDGLRNDGWFFGCIVFERHGTDYLRMQYSTATIHLDTIQIATPFGRELVDFVVADRGYALNVARGSGIVQ